MILCDLTGHNCVVCVAARILIELSVQDTRMRIISLKYYNMQTRWARPATEDTGTSR